MSSPGLNSPATSSPPVLDIREAIARAVEGRDLTAEEARSVMDGIMRGEATPAQIAAWITALRMKGETVAEIVGCARSMRDHAHRIRPRVQNLVDTCGTGGDGAHTFNVSTAAAFVVAAAGAPVAKHGNRSVSSRCGSADALEALGIQADLEPDRVARCIDEVGIGFLFAPRFHQAMKHAVGPRREVGIRTVFNVLGPLTNPAGAETQLLGVFDPRLTELLALVLKELGCRAALVVHGLDGLDELSIRGPSRVSELRDGQVRTYELVPEDAGLKSYPGATIPGGDPAYNAEIIQRVLEGEGGPARDLVLLNAAAALVAAGVASDFPEGVERAQEAVASGAARRKLQALREMAPRVS